MEYKLYDKVNIIDVNVEGFIVDISRGKEGAVYTVEETHKDGTSDMHYNLEKDDIELIKE